MSVTKTKTKHRWNYYNVPEQARDDYPLKIQVRRTGDYEPEDPNTPSGRYDYRKDVWEYRLTGQLPTGPDSSIQVTITGADLYVPQFHRYNPVDVARSVASFMESYAERYTYAALSVHHDAGSAANNEPAPQLYDSAGDPLPLFTYNQWALLMVEAERLGMWRTMRQA